MTDDAQPCPHCGSTDPDQHTWVEGDCILPHRRHSRRLLAGTHVCEPCVERHGKWLTEITELWATLGTVLDLGSVPDDTAEHKHTQRDGSPAQMRLDAWALAHPGMLNAKLRGPDGNYAIDAYLGGHVPDVRHVLAAWAEALWDTLGWGEGWPTSVEGAAASLRANLPTIAGLPDVDTFDAELAWVRRHLRSAHGLSDPMPLGHCLSVDCGGMVWPQPGKEPRCSHCGRRYGTLALARLKVQEDRAS